MSCNDQVTTPVLFLSSGGGQKAVATHGLHVPEVCAIQAAVVLL